MNSKGLQEFKLGELCAKIGSGVTPRGGENVYKQKGISLIRSQNVYDYEFEPNGLVFIDEEQAEKMKNVEVLTNDVLLNITGDSVARCCMVPERVLPARVNQHVSIIRANSHQLDPKYLLYWINNFSTKELLLSLASTGGTRKALTKSMIESLKLIVPSNTEQKSIAATLSCLDDKIELNNRINKTLEETAQAIYRSWFVNFEPFQDGDFEDCELGRIPKGWRVGRLSEIIDLFDSKRIPLSSRQREVMEKKYPYYGATSLMDYVDDYIFDGIYVLLGEDGTVVDNNGYPILQYVWGKFWVNNHAHILKGTNGFTEESIYMFLKNTSVQSIVTGAVQPKINQANLKSLKVLIPLHEIISEYNNLLKPIFAEIRRGYEENQALISIRDTLLPKLMSGEIRVPIEEVV